MEVTQTSTTSQTADPMDTSATNTTSTLSTPAIGSVAPLRGKTPPAARAPSPQIREKTPPVAAKTAPVPHAKTPPVVRGKTPPGSRGTIRPAASTASLEQPAAATLLELSTSTSRPRPAAERNSADDTESARGSQRKRTREDSSEESGGEPAQKRDATMRMRDYAKRGTDQGVWTNAALQRKAERQQERQAKRVLQTEASTTPSSSSTGAATAAAAAAAVATVESPAAESPAPPSTPRRQPASTTDDPTAAARSTPQVQVRIVNGQIVLNKESLTVASSAADEPHPREVYQTVVETNTHVTSSSYTNRQPAQKWTDEEVELFYKAISQFGTDFALICKLFPQRTRAHVKNKFKKEEKENPTRIERALRNRQPHDPTLLATMMAAAPPIPRPDAE